MNFRRFYYHIKPIVPRAAQLALRRQLIRIRRRQFQRVWPINAGAAAQPPNWRGWPEGKQFAVVLTHDVESSVGQKKCLELMQLEQKAGFRSSFNFVPERYPDRPELRQAITAAGFEVGVHGLNHDGKLYASLEVFRERAIKINRYLQEWNAVGFRSPAMHHNLQWLRLLNIEYDSSTFDTDPFEPQPDGMNTVFPFWVSGENGKSGYLELPYTLPQDFTLFVLMKEKSIALWKKKVEWIARVGGMVLLNTHPDYMNFSGCRNTSELYSARFYGELLGYLKNQSAGRFWHGLPRELAAYWKTVHGLPEQAKLQTQ